MEAMAALAPGVCCCHHLTFPSSSFLGPRPPLSFGLPHPSSQTLLPFHAHTRSPFLVSSKPCRIARASAVADAVEITEVSEPNSRVRLNVKVAPKICKESYDEVLTELSKRTKIPGFRTGKRIPETVLVNFVGKEQVKTTAIEAVLRKTLPQAMSSVAGRALKDSEHIVTKIDELKSTFSPTSVLSYDVVVDVLPDVKWASEDAYRNLKVVVEIDDEASIERSAEAELKSRHKDLGSLRIVQDRGVHVGDVVILDISAKHINEDGSEGDRILSAEQKGFQVDTEEGISFLPGFVDAIVGLERGETRSFELTFPDTWQQEALRGVKGLFMVECKEHFYRVLPGLDDSIAERLLPGCSTLDQVKDALLQKHRDIYDKAKLRATQMAIIDELSKVAEIEVPNSLLEEQGRNMYAAKLIELQASMTLSKEQVVGLSSPEMVNNYLLSQKKNIADAVKQTVAVAEIFKRENLKYSDEELDKEVQSAEEEFKLYKQEYDKDRLREQAKEVLEGTKVLDWLMEHADISYV